jgi:hypothetical protein
MLRYIRDGSRRPATATAQAILGALGEIGEQAGKKLSDFAEYLD